jgi:L-ribulokinase
LDWINGRRTPDANQELKSAIANLSLGTKAPHVFKSLVNAICFGSKKIVDRFEEEGVRIDTVIGIGGVARKSPFIMQMMADVMKMPIRIHKSEQTCAAGAAMFAATAAGIYPKVEEAMQAMGQGFDVTYKPDSSKSAYYESKFKKYNTLGNFISNE